MIRIIFIIIMSLALLHPNLSYSDNNTSSITVRVKDTSFNTIPMTDSMSMIVYQDFNTTPFKQIEAIPTNPYTISGLQSGHHYSVEVYVNGVWSGVGYVDLGNTLTNLDITIPITGGVSFSIFYNDGYTPIPNAHVAIQSQDGKTWETTVTDPIGKTPPYWLESQSRDQDYYKAYITIVNSISYTYYPIKLSPGISHDVKIVTPWPATISNLISVSVYDGPNKVSSNDGTFFVELYNETGLVGKSNVNNHGDAVFSNLKVDEYVFKAFKSSSDHTKSPQLWGSKDSIINGSQNSISIHKNEVEKANLSSRIATQSCECVAFRLDDIQDYFLKNQQEKVMDIFLEKNASLTIGVIGNALGKDKQLLDYLQNRVKSTTAPIEIANHGWNHENFAQFSAADQVSLINKTNQKIIAMFGVKPVTFLTPLNGLNNETYKAVIADGMTHLSTSNNPDDKPPYPLTNATLYRFPETAYTARLSDQGIFTGTTHDYVMQQIQKNMNMYGFAVIMMHPQDFSLKVNKTYTSDIDWIQVYELRALIDQVRNSGLKIVPIEKIDLDNSKNILVKTHQEGKSVVPSWLKNNSKWWEKDQISDSEFINAVQYLIKNKVMTIQNFTTPYQPSDKQIIPWMKTNAGLWASGGISDKEFATGIHYLIMRGIIIS